MLTMLWLCVLFVLMPARPSSGEFGVPQNLTSSSPCTDTNHLFLAPGVLTAGGTNRACVSRFHTEGPARMVLTLVEGEVQAATAARELPPGDGGCIDIAVPLKPNTKAKLVVQLWYPDAKCTWQRSLPAVVSGGRVVVVQPERGRYRAGETLRARIRALKPDLTPAHGLIDEVWLEGPMGAWEGSRAAQWLRVRTRMGLAQIQHELDELAPAGRWTIRAKLADGSQGSAVFWVGNYELPPFQLSVRHAPRVLRTAERLVWTVCVRYPWTEAVEGMLVIRIRGAGAASGTGAEADAAEARSIRTVARLKAPRACHRHAAAARRVGLERDNPPDVLVADFSFQEDGTRIWQNTTVVSQVVDKPVTLEFLRKMGAVISPGLPYKLKVKATRWDDKPGADERVRVCRSAEGLGENLPLATNETCLEAVTDDRGIARVTFTADDDGSTFYTFKASLQNDSSTTAEPLQLAARHAGSVHASLGPVKPDLNSAKTFVPLYLSLRDVARPLTVHFVVITRGGIIYRWGATTQCPVTSSAEYIPTTSRNTQCYYNYDVSQANVARPSNVYLNAANSQANAANSQANTANMANVANAANNETNDPDSLLDRHLLRIMLPIKVTHQMCPDSHLVAYFYYKGEFVSASKQFEMDECFSNKVEATWLSRQVSPGALASLRVSTAGPALCALAALDSAAKWDQPAPSVKDLVMAGLRRLVDSHRNLTEYEAQGPCFNTSDVPELPSNSLEQTSAWLASAGVRVAGGDMTEARRCITPPAPLMDYDDVTVPRSDFSEAWLWRLVAVGANGTSAVSARAPDSISRFEATAVCIARTGISVSPPAVLQVFREFFIHADVPRRLRRGDTTVVRYRLFNYLYEPLSVEIQVLTDAHLEGPASAVETACVPARASIARRAALKARAPGAARLALRARATAQPAANCAGSNGNKLRKPVSDEVIIPITVDPEGVPVQEHKSILLCGRGSAESSLSEVSWSWPPIQAVAGTEAVTVWAMGDIKGPLLFDADGLVTLPRGCGEQNMARLAANLLALAQLTPDSAAAATAKEHVSRGFTRQLQYVHPKGGFSAFGGADLTPSTWLTAFSLKYMRRAHQILNPELPVPPALERAERWLLTQQMENGCFRNEGQVFHKELRGGLNEEGEIASVALAAYVITALVDSAAPLPARVLRNALACLRALPPIKTRTPTRVYAHALLGYAFMKLRTYEDDLRKTNEASLLWDKREAIGAGLKEDEELRELMELLKVARRSGDYVWWETSSLSTSVEATAYALLALSHCPAPLRDTSCATDALAAIRWLSLHRNHAGGFLSTQDTLVALEALSSWSSVQPSTPPNLTVRLKSGSDLKKISILPDTKVPEITRITDKSQVDVSVEGTGCALIQATRSYNTLSSDQPENKQLTVQATVHTDGVFNCDVNETNCFCAAVVEVCVSWTGVFPTMAVVEATLPTGFGVDASRLYAQLQEPDTLIRRIELSPSGGRVTLYLQARADAGAGHSCAALLGVGPRARTRPAHVRVLDYYAPATNDTQMYTIPEDCPPRIAHTTDDYLPSDNLFNKARSLTDSGEILITHEFSFEDIPEGIPLEDPIYDLVRDDMAYLTKHSEGPLAKENTNDNPRTEIIQPYYNFVDNDLRANNNDNIETINSLKTQTKSDYLDARTPSAEDKRNKALRKDVNHRKGHSIPFDSNFASRNLNVASKVNDYSNVHYGQVRGQSYLYPDRVFYEINPYLRRTNEHNNYDYKHYEEKFHRPHDRIYIPLVENERLNKETFTHRSIKQSEHHNGSYSYTGDHEQVPLNLNNRPINAQNEKVGFGENTIPETTGIETVKSPSTYIPEQTLGFKMFHESNKTEVIAHPDHAIDATKQEMNAQADIPYLHVPSEINTSLSGFQSTDPNISPFKPVDENNNAYPTSTKPNKDTERTADQIATLNSSNDPSALHNEHNLNIQSTPTNSDIALNTDSIAKEKDTSVPTEINPNTSKYTPSNHMANSDARPAELDRLAAQSFTDPNSGPRPSNYNPYTLNQNNVELDGIAAQSLTDPSNLNPMPSTYNPVPNRNSALSDMNKPSYNVGVSSILTTDKSSQVDNPNLSGFHVIDSEVDLDVPSGMEGPVPAVALPPQNFVAVAPPPGFQPPFLHGGYPRQYSLPPRPQYPYYRQYVPAT